MDSALAPGILVEHRWPIELIYVASASLWLWVGLEAALRSRIASTGLVSITAAVVFAVVSTSVLSRSARTSRTRYRCAVEQAMQILVDAPWESDEVAANAGRVLARHLGAGKDGAKRYERRIRFYLQRKNAEDYLPSIAGRVVDPRQCSPSRRRRSQDSS